MIKNSYKSNYGLRMNAMKASIVMRGEARECVTGFKDRIQDLAPLILRRSALPGGCHTLTGPHRFSHPRFTRYLASSSRDT